jgi:NTP pyrophosphatase (non-canonical NTP hydrolase)
MEIKVEYKYEDIVRLTKIYPDSAKYIYAALGLTSEAGEVAGKIKKFVRGDYDSIDDIRDNIIDELGDVLWYITALSIELDTNLDEIKERNATKLINRLKRNKISGEGDYR